MGAARRRKLLGQPSGAELNAARFADIVKYAASPEDAAIIAEWEASGDIPRVNILSVAYHEASHAVAGLRTGLHLDSVNVVRRIVRDDESFELGGRSEEAAKNGGCTMLTHEAATFGDIMTFSLAGALGEAKLGITDVDGASGDLHMVRNRLLGDMSPEDANDTIAYAVEQISEFLNAPCNWAAITEVAERLLVEKTLDGSVVQEIVVKHCGEDVAYYSGARRAEREEAAA